MAPARGLQRLHGVADDDGGDVIGESAGARARLSACNRSVRAAARSARRRAVSRLAMSPLTRSPVTPYTTSASVSVGLAAPAEPGPSSAWAPMPSRTRVRTPGTEAAVPGAEGDDQHQHRVQRGADPLVEDDEQRDPDDGHHHRHGVALHPADAAAR